MGGQQMWGLTATQKRPGLASPDLYLSEDPPQRRPFSELPGTCPA